MQRKERNQLSLDTNTKFGFFRFLIGSRTGNDLFTKRIHCADSRIKKWYKKSLSHLYFFFLDI